MKYQIKSTTADCFNTDRISFSATGYIEYYDGMTEAEAERRLDSLKNDKCKTAILLRNTIKVQRASASVAAHVKMLGH